MASNQSVYAPARPDGETTGEWDEFSVELPAEFPPDDAVEHTSYRLPAQRGPARGSAVLDIAAMAAVGGGTAPVLLSDAPPEAPAGRTERFAGTERFDGSERGDGTEPSDRTGGTGRLGGTDPGEALRARIVIQATEAREAVARAEREAAAKAAAEQAARAAAAQKVREQAAATKAAAEAKAKAEAAAAAEAEAERAARLAASYIKPISSYTLTAGFGEADPWGNFHAGQDFDAPTGTPVHAVHGGTVVAAGWAGSYGYRVVVALDDRTELWYCHLSTMVVTSGRVTTGDTIGRVGATGNVPGPHLHLEVRPEGGEAVDPLPWLRSREVEV